MASQAGRHSCWSSALHISQNCTWLASRQVNRIRNLCWLEHQPARARMRSYCPGSARAESSLAAERLLLQIINTLCSCRQTMTQSHQRPAYHMQRFGTHGVQDTWLGATWMQVSGCHSAAAGWHVWVGEVLLLPRQEAPETHAGCKLEG